MKVKFFDKSKRLVRAANTGDLHTIKYYLSRQDCGNLE